MNQCKLELVKQEMARVNINILEIKELKWNRMGEFDSDDHYIYYSGQESLRGSGVALIVNKRVQNAVLGYNLKTNRMILVHFQGKPFNITVICSNHWCQRSWSWPILWRPTTPSRTNTRKRCPFHHRGLECKSRKLRDNWSNREVWPFE